MHNPLPVFPLAGICIAALATAACSSNGRNLRVEINEGTQFAVEANGQSSLYLDVQGMLWQLPTEGGTAKALTTTRDDIRRPHLSPDSQELIYETFSNGYWHIGHMTLPDQRRQLLTTGAHDDREPAWSADGRHIWFVSDRSGNEDIWALRVVDGQLLQITSDPAADYSPAASAGSLVFVSERGNKAALYELKLDADGMPPESAIPTPLAAAPAGKLWPPRFSRDGSQLAWVQASRRNAFPSVAINELVVMDIATGQQRTVSPPQDDVFSAPPAWLDTDTLLYTASGSIRRLDLEDGANSVIPWRARLELQETEFTKKEPLAFTGQLQPALGIVDPVMLADDSIVYTALGDLWQIDTAGEQQQLTNSAWVERDITVSPDNSTLAYISDRSGSMQIWLRNLQTGNERQLTQASKGPRYPTFAPNGRLLAYQQTGPRGTQDFTVHVLDLSNAEDRRLRSAPPIWPGRMSWSADSTHLTVAELFSPAPRFGDGANRLIRIDVANDSASAETLPAGMAPDSGPSGAPDGHAIALVINGALWRAPTAPDGRISAAPQLLLDELTETPTWSADSTQLTTLTPRGLETISVDSGQRQLRNPTMTWTPAVRPGLRIVHAGRVFSGAGNAYLEDVDITIDGARIVSVLPHQPHPPEVELLDATNMTVIPGLIDHHVHFEGHKGEWTGRALLAFGVTTVVEPGGLPYESREQLEAWSSGRRTGPRLVYAGPQLDGERRTFYFGTHVRSERRLQWELQRAEKLGYGLIKTYRRLPPELQAKAVELGHEQGLPVTAHAAIRNVGFGGDRSEHLRGSGRLAYSSKQSDFLKSYADFAAIFTATGSAITPTLVNQGAFFEYLARHPELLDNRQYTSLYPAADRQALAAFSRIVSKNLELVRSGLQNAQSAVARLHAGGASVVAGTDSPIFPYGLSLIVELDSYVNAGLSTAEALRTATSAAAQELGAGAAVGTIEAGKLADLVIIAGDPLNDITDLLDVRGVMKNGQYWAIDELLQEPQ